MRSYTRVSAQRDYRLTNAATGAIVARATTTWAYVDRDSQIPRRIPTEVSARLPTHAVSSVPGRVAWGEPVVLPPLATVSWPARGYEADQLRHVNNCVYADWLSEAARLAFDQWRDSADPRLGVLCLESLVPRRVSLHYQRSARPGDMVAIASSPERVGSRGVAIAQTIALAGDPAAVLLTASATYLLG